MHPQRFELRWAGLRQVISALGSSLAAAGPSVFWATIALCALLRLLLLADLGPPLADNPYDVTLYMSRAYHLLHGEGLGGYNATLTIKLPGMSFWIAWMRWLGMPLMLSLHLTHVLSGAYLVGALRRVGLRAIPLVVAYGLYALNQLTLQRPLHLREPLDASLLVLMLGAMVFVWHGLWRGSFPLGHILAFSAALSFALLLREEGVLYYLLLGLLVAGSIYILWQRDQMTGRTGRATLAAVLLVPLLVVAAGDAGARSFMLRHYNSSLLNDLTEGEFPRFIAALRSVRSDDRTPAVSIPRDAQIKVAQAVPHLDLVFKSILPAPGPDSEFHQAYRQFRGVVDEWPDSHIFFWIKGGAQHAGRTGRDMARAQDYFRKARQDIEAACAAGKLECVPNGSGLLPPMRWARLPELLREAANLGGRLLLFASQPLSPSGVTMPEGDPRYEVALGNKIEVATMTPFDSLAQWHLGAIDAGDAAWSSPFPAGEQLFRNLSYWQRYPDVAANPLVGLMRHITEAIRAPLATAVAPLGISPSSNAPVRSLTAHQQQGLAQLGLLDPGDLSNNWQGAPINVYLVLRWLMLHPEQAFNLAPDPALGAEKFAAYAHYQHNGKYEGREFFRDGLGAFDSNALGLKPPRGVLAEYRPALAQFEWHLRWVIVLGLGTCLFQLARRVRSGLRVLDLLIVAFVAFVASKILALAYIALTMGLLDNRLLYSMHTAMLLLFTTLLVQALLDGTVAAAPRLGRARWWNAAG